MTTVALDELWYTRCPVPTASGLAYTQGWLTRAFEPHGIRVGALQEAPPELSRHHYDHQLPGLFREGGNVPALGAYAQGAPTRLVGLTWIEEWQTIVVRPDSGIESAADLVGTRVALPVWSPGDRGLSFQRAMALHGFSGALASAGLRLDDVRFVEVGGLRDDVRRNGSRLASMWRLDDLVDGRVDAVYVKGAAAAEEAKRLGLTVAVNLDDLADPRLRVNNGTPRPITVHADVLEQRPDLVVAFLVETLRAADWADSSRDEVSAMLQRETDADAESVIAAYGEDFNRGLHPDLSDERLALLARQKDFLLVHGFLDRDVDVYAWAAPEPLRAARAQLGAEAADYARLESARSIDTQ